MSDKLQKLKVTELKELLAANNLPQTGKKEDLINRLVDAGVAGEGDEELVDIPEPTSAPPAAQAAVDGTAAADAINAAPPAASEAPAAEAPAPSAEDTPAVEPELTEEQKKQKARAERFGIPWVPPKRPVDKPAASTDAPSAKPKADKAPVEKKDKPAAIDSAPVGVSDEVLAKRAARFGLPEKKESASAPTAETAVAAQEDKKDALTPEMAEKIKEEEEKKRKRAEKFGAPAAAENGDEPDAKKAKV